MADRPQDAVPTRRFMGRSEGKRHTHTLEGTHTIMNTEMLATALRIAACLDTEPVSARQLDDAGRWVIVRGDRSGVFYGYLVSEHGQTVELADCRHIWYWSGAANTAEIALRGVSKPDDCKIVAPVARLRVLDAIEVIDCTDDAVASLNAVPEWSEQ